MKKYVSYLDSISVGTEMHERTMKRLTKKPTPLYKNHVIHHYTGLVVCLAIILAGVFTIPSLFNKPVENIPGNPYNPGEIDTSLIGLPVDNFSLADIQIGAETDRMVYTKLSDFFLTARHECSRLCGSSERSNGRITIPVMVAAMHGNKNHHYIFFQIYGAMMAIYQTLSRFHNRFTAAVSGKLKMAF